MNKKEYKQPSMKVIELEGNDILAGSNEPSALSITDDYVDEEPQVGVPSDIWGKQW